MGKGGDLIQEYEDGWITAFSHVLACSELGGVREQTYIFKRNGVSNVQNKVGTASSSRRDSS